MCGIIAYLGNQPFSSYVLTGLRLLLNRGYDSVGISTIDATTHSIVTMKHASTTTSNNCFDLVQQEFDSNPIASTIGIGHTRWATHGPKTTINAHPHQDNSCRISLVHNGIIENYAEIKKKLMDAGYTFQSQTDTEVIAVLIGKHLDKFTTDKLTANNSTATSSTDVANAIRNSLLELNGTWALVIIHKDFPNRIWITRNGSPLLLGIEEGYVMVASENVAFSNHIEKYVVLENHDIIEIEYTANAIRYSDIVHLYPLKIKPPMEMETLPPEYAHWMLKEIYEQPDAVVRAMNNKGRISKTTDFHIKFGGFEKQENKAKLMQVRHLILLGCGTSYHAGLWSIDLFKKSGIFHTVQIFDGAEFDEKDIPKSDVGSVGTIFLSQSGETKDLHRCIEIAKKCGCMKIGVVNVVDSMIARDTDCGVYINAGREIAVASTKSFTNQCVILSMISEWFFTNHQIQTQSPRNSHYSRHSHYYQDLCNLPFHLQQVLDTIRQLKEDSATKSLLETWAKKTTIFILGKRQQEAIAREGALKIKEVAYLHAEGYSSSALKHGAFALIEPGLPIILLDIDEEYAEKHENVYQEVAGRGADVLLIQKMGEKNSDPIKKTWTVPKNQTFGGVLANIYLQWISYEIAVIRQLSPDYPRNLAKVVTVE